MIEVIEAGLWLIISSPLMKALQVFQCLSATPLNSERPRWAEGRGRSESYALLATHQADKTIVGILQRDHFQDGNGAWRALLAFGRVPINNLTLRDMDKQFHDLDIIHDVGINANTIRLIDQKMKYLNSKRPAANRFTETQLTEKLLELIFTTSKHFSDGALLEFNAAAGSRNFEHAPGAVLASNVMYAIGVCPPLS